MAIAERVGAATPDNEHTLAVAVVVALVLHGFLLVLIGLDLAYSPPRPAPALRVALTPRTAPVPESSVVSPPLPEPPATPAAQAPAEPQPVEEYVPDPPEPELEPVETPQVVDTRAAAPEQTEAEPPPPAPAPTPKAAPTPAITGPEIQSMGLALARAGLPEPPSNPRHKRLDTSAMTTMEEFYIQAWVDKVQRVGENNFPPAAMGLGEVHCPVLDIVLKADGSIDKLKVTESCGDPALDNAALDIVLMAAPFAPFPAELERNYDTLQFSRRWMFDDGRVRTGG